jgi:hypothetical protein
MLLLMVSSA